MRVRGSGGIRRDLQMLFDHGTATAVSDRELVGRFRDRFGQDAQAAFAALVARHGPMVLRVCGAILRDTNDIEDAFQATFLVLARKAHTIRATEAVGSWLFGVALRTAAHTRMDAIRRCALERRWAASRSDPPADQDRHGLETAVFEEVSRMPEEYRRTHRALLSGRFDPCTGGSAFGMAARHCRGTAGTPHGHCSGRD